MICDDIRIALSEGEVCEETDDRGARIFTHCLYPSFEPVAVYVARKGDGYVVTDGGGASASAYLHGREELGKVLLRECARFGVDCKEDTVVADVVEHIRGEKKISFKMKRRKGYHKTIGHRQELTVVKITAINA